MRILHVNIKDNLGAGTAAYRMHKALLKSNVDSTMLVMDKSIDDDTIVNLNKNNYHRLLTKLFIQLEKLHLRIYKKRENVIFSGSEYSRNYVKQINKINPDVVHFHWINKGFFSLGQIVKIKAPVVFSLHDMWLFTGGCHYSNNCRKYMKECGDCIILKSNRQNDFSRKLYKRKQRIFSKKNELWVVGLSKWMADCAKKSSLLKKEQVVQLPNCIDVDTYKPVNKESTRKKYNLPTDKKLIMFGAMSSTSDRRKGFKELVDTILKLPDDKFELVIFGADSSQDIERLPAKAHFMGHISDYKIMIELYSMADITIVPSLEENLSNVIMESLCCGSPVAGFGIGGNSDMVKSGYNGYLAKPYDTEELAKGIESIIFNTETQKHYSDNARNYILNNFNEGNIALRYIELYNIITAK